MINIPIINHLHKTRLLSKRVRNTFFGKIPQKIKGGLYLRGCTSLTSLPEGLTVGRGLYLGGCTSLTSLPEGLTVGGNLNLGRCTSLTSLPEGLTVGGDLNLEGCTSWDGVIPKDTKIKGKVYR